MGDFAKLASTRTRRSGDAPGRSLIRPSSRPLELLESESEPVAIFGRNVPVVIGGRSGRSNGPFGRTKELGLAEPGNWRMAGQGDVWPLGIVRPRRRKAPMSYWSKRRSFGVPETCDLAV
jgi:hypothetical protein